VPSPLAPVQYRNYFVAVAGEFGQTSQRQLDRLADVGHKLSQTLGKPAHALWAMRNDYALCSADGWLQTESSYKVAAAQTCITVFTANRVFSAMLRLLMVNCNAVSCLTGVLLSASDCLRTSHP
jgi:hypothetical protein